jgi:hypothetical protein
LKTATMLGLAALVGFGAAAAAAAWDECLVITTDYSIVGWARTLGREAPWTVSGDLEEICGDAVARWHGGLYHVVNRSGCDNLQVLDPAAGYQTLRQFSLGVGRNPQDIAFRADGIAFVSCYDAAVLLKVDVEAGAVLATYSTAAFADPDGLPETKWMQAVGDLLLICCQRMDRDNWWLPYGGSSLLVFDMAAETWVDAVPGTPGIDPVDLAGENPDCQLELTPDRTAVRVGCVGEYGLLDGGIEVVDLATLTSLGFEITEAQLGGDLLDFESGPEGLVWVIVSDPGFRTSVRTFDRDTGALTVAATSSGYDYTDIACDGAAHVYLCDRTLGASGIRVFDAVTGLERTAAPRPTGLPPYMVVLPKDEALTAVPPAPAALVGLDPPWPNPANPATRLRVRGPAGGMVALRVLDLRGRLVRTLTATLDAAGVGTVEFDGRDARGRRLPSGSYRVVAEGPAGGDARILSIVR